MDNLQKTLVENLDRFTAFVRSRVNDPDLAADVVQDSLLKALKSAPQLRSEDNLVAWFYKILRHSIIDLYRRKAAAAQGNERLQAESDAAILEDENSAICQCLDGIVPTLKPEYATLIQQIDLAGEPLDRVAARLNITPNNLNVRLYRARHQLKQRLEQTCKMCSRHGCLNCTCDHPSAQ